jgi:hypothetical protein
MIVIVILSFAAAGILSYSLNTYTNSVRQRLTDQAKVIADSEMENLYYNWHTALLAKVPVANVQNYLAHIPQGQGPTSSNVPFESDSAVGLQSASNGWSVDRSLVFQPIQGTSDGSAQGLVNNGLQIGRNYYFTAETRAYISNPILGTVEFKSGRHFVYSSTSLFQFAVFYQGNLEMAAGGNMTIGGPISTNASAYLGAQASGNTDSNGVDHPFVLQLSDSVYYFQDYNGNANPMLGETRVLEGSANLVDPIYNPDTSANSVPPADQVAQRQIQVQQLPTQSSFIGGVDVAADIANSSYQAAYTNLQGQVDPNEVYRAVIAPPPTDSQGNLLPEDPIVAASRMYNSAGILITINQTSAGAPTAGNVTINVGTAANPTLYNNDPAFASIVNPTSTTDTYGRPTSIIQTPRTQIVDPRELLNGTTGVNLTTLDVGNLNTALAAAMVSDNTLASNYNGVVYIYDNTDNSTVQPNTLNGIRLVNGTTTPNYSDQNGNPLGFTVVSNNGVYVQGDYNTTQITAGGAQVNNPAAVMGDAITALSFGWNQSQNTTLQGWEQRPAAPTPTTDGYLTTLNPAYTDTNGTMPANGVNPPFQGTPNGMTVNAAILTGNTPSTTTTASGGAQNLVRMIEDWYYPDPTGNGTGMALTLNGSLGQLFSSKYFRSNYPGSGEKTGLGADGPPDANGVQHYNKVYIQPRTRIVSYDAGFKTRTPAGSPTTTAFSRGDFFFW